MAQGSYSYSYHKHSGRILCRHTVTLLDGSKQPLHVYGKNKTEAGKKMDEKIAEAMQYGVLKTSKLSLANYLTFWIQYADGLRSGTRRKHLGNIDNHIIPFIGDVQLRRIDESILQQFFNTLYTEGRKPRTVQISRNILSRALREAAGKKLMYPINMRNIRLKPYNAKEKKIWTLDEAKTFLQAAQKDNYYLFFLLYLQLGLRRGEGIALHWEDVDFTNNILHIRRQFTDVGNGFGIQDLKTKNSKRDLPLIPTVKEQLLAIQKQTNKTTGPIICSEDGSYVNPSSIRHHLSKIIKQENISSVDIHSMRHYTATMLKELNVPDVDIQKIMGHASVKTTIECYESSTMNAKAKALNSLSQYFVPNYV